MMVPIEKVFLRNKQLEAKPSNQTESPFYQRVRDSIKKRDQRIITAADNDMAAITFLVSIIILLLSLF